MIADYMSDLKSAAWFMRTSILTNIPSAFKEKCLPLRSLLC